MQTSTNHLLLSTIESSAALSQTKTLTANEQDATLWLPDETLLYILSLLPDLSARTKAKLVCKRWNQVASDKALFSFSLFKKEHPSSALVHLECDTNFLESYQQARLIEKRIKDSSFNPHAQAIEVEGIISIGKGKKGQFFFYLSQDKEYAGGVHIWNSFDKEEISLFTLDQDVWINCFLEHDGYIYGGGSSSLFKWKIDTDSMEEDLSVISHKWNITSLVWAEDHLFSSSLDTKINEYDKDLNILKTYSIHETSITCFVYDNGKFFSASRDDCKLYIWQKDSSEKGWKTLHTLSTEFQVTSIQPFDDKLYYSEGSTIHVMDLKSFTEIQRFETRFCYNENLTVFDR